MQHAKSHVEEVLERLGVLQKGHFRLTSGKHSDSYMQCAKLFEHPIESADLCAELAARLSDKKIQTVIGPALGGIIMAYEMGRALGARVLFAERENNVMTLRRGFSVSQGERVLVVEDVVTTGGSVHEVIRLLKESGAELVAVASIVDRSGGTADFGAPFYPLITKDIPAWDEHDCPLCKQGAPIVKPGSRMRN